MSLSLPGTPPSEDVRAANPPTWIALILVPVIFALFSVPAGGQTPTLDVTSPAPDAVVAGEVLFQGSAEDPDGDLEWVEIEVEGAKGAPLKTRIPGNRVAADWEIPWGSQSVPDGRWAVGAVARDKAGNVSESVNFTLVVDNFQEPRVDALQVYFDEADDGNYTAWDAPDAMPTTRVAFNLTFSEAMNESAVRAGVAFDGGALTWELTRNGTESYRVNVTYLEANASYNFTVGAPGADQAGNPVAPYDLGFLTVADPTAGTPEPPEEPSEPDDPTEPGDPDEPRTNEGGWSLPFAVDSRFLWMGGLMAALAVALATVWWKGLRSGDELEDRYESPFYEDDE